MIARVDYMTALLCGCLLAAPARAVQLHTIDSLNNTLVMLDTQTGMVTSVNFIGLPNLINHDLALLGGWIWAIEQFGPVHQLFRIDPATGPLVKSNQVLVDGLPTGPSTGLAARGGELIVAFTPDPEGIAATHLGTLDPDGSIRDVVSFELFGARFFALATGPDGSELFSAGAFAMPQLLRATIDPVTFEILGGKGLGNVNDLVFVGDELWGLDSIAQDASFLFRIDPDNGEILETVQIQVLAGQSLFSGLVFIPCAGDIDGDGEVGILDFLDLLGAWGPNPGHAADLDGDGVFCIIDFLSLLGAWGTFT